MMFTHAFWSKPLLNKKFNSYNTGLAINLINAAYSVACCHKFGYKIKLYADKQGIELFKYIPYDEVIELDIPEDLNYHFAASVKFYALQKMTLNDVLIDTDLFIENKKGYDVIRKFKGDMLYSYYEDTESLFKFPKRYGKLINLMSTRDYKYTLPTEDTVCWPNTSLMKFNNKELKNKYIEQYFYHKSVCEDIDFGHEWPDIIIEQYFLNELASENNYTISPLVEINNENMLETLGYSHLGAGKMKHYEQVRINLWVEDNQTLKKLVKQYKELTGKELP